MSEALDRKTFASNKKSLPLFVVIPALTCGEDREGKVLENTAADRGGADGRVSGDSR